MPASVVMPMRKPQGKDRSQMRAATAHFARPRLLALLQGTVSAFILAAVCVAPAGAATVAIGQIAPVGTTSACISCTDFQGSTGPTSPSYVVPAGTWTITSWSAQAGTNVSQARLRVFRPGPTSDEYTVLAESLDESIPANTSGPFATSIPVQGGDLIGIRTGDSPGNISPTYSSGTGEDIFFGVVGDPAVGNTVCGAGSTFPSCTSSGGILTNIAATLFAPSPAPSNAFTFGSLKRNTHNGTATVAVNVPGPGTLSLTGKGVKTQRAGGAVTSKSVTAAGVVKLLIKARGAAKRKLNRTGKMKVKVKVTFTPTGGSPGTQSKRVKLIKKR
jgi:hypothetical protein